MKRGGKNTHRSATNFQGTTRLSGTREASVQGGSRRGCTVELVGWVALGFGWVATKLGSQQGEEERERKERKQREEIKEIWLN